MSDARIGLFDIETSPSLGYFWQAYDTSVIDIHDDWQILSFAWKWLGEETKVYTLFEYDEEELIALLWKHFNESDIIVGHNLDAFDIKKANAMFLRYDLPPPSPYKTVDTMKVAKKYFKFDMNKLNFLARHLGLGQKLKHTGWDTWLGCLEGDPTAWGVMRDYNAQDVELLEKVYLILRPWHSTHPNLNLYSEKHNCPTCGSGKVQRRGYSYAKVQIRQRFCCTDCGHWWSGKIEKKSIL